MKDRFLEICKYTNQSASALSLKLGQSRGFIKSCSKGCNSLVLHNLLVLYPNINPYWLLNGTGEMFVDLDSPSLMKKLALSNAEYKSLYNQLRAMFESVVKENQHLREINLKLMAQNAEIADKLPKDCKDE